MRWSSSPASPGQGSRHWHSARSTPKPSGDISSPSLPTHVGCSTRCRCLRSMRSRPAACRRAAAAARFADDAVVGRQRDDAVESIEDALFARRRISSRAAAAVCRAFSPNTPDGACPHCHGLGRIYDATERSMVPDDSLTIRERAIAAWPPAWHGQNLRDIVTTLGYDIDRPWRELPERGPQLAAVHRRAAGCAGLCRLRPSRSAARAQKEGRAELSGHVHGRTALRAAHVRQHAEPADEAARVALSGQRRLPDLPWQAAEAGGALGDVRGPATSPTCRVSR